MKLFGTSGIRGRTFKEITPQLAERVGRAFASYLGQDGQVVVGRDTRHGAEIIEYALVAGLAAAGVNVIRCGEIATPALAHYARTSSSNAAVIITGSHMPPDRIGIIPMLSDGSYLYGTSAEFVERKVLEVSAGFGLIQDPSKAGRITVAEKEALESYKLFLLEKAEQELLQSANFRVLVDPGNGTACYFAVQVLQELGCDVVPLNNNPSGTPNRSAEPRASTLQDTLTAVKKAKCDLGIAIDLDADRILFLTPRQVVPENLIGAILADTILENARSGSCLVLPINTSGLINEVVRRHRSTKIVFCRIGQPATIDTVKKEPSCVFAFEESGKYYFINDGVLWTDGCLSAIRLLEILARRASPLDELSKDYPEYVSITKSIRIPEGQGQDLFNHIKVAFESQFENREITLLRVDGLRADFPDGAWLLLRPSGTEPLIRVVTDAPTKARAQTLLNEGLSIVEDLLERT